MLRNTFVHIPGVGRTTERRLWDMGCMSWGDLLDSPTKWSLGSACMNVACTHLSNSIEALDKQDHRFFRNCLGGSLAWRAYPEFLSSTVYLDIETDGGQGIDSITTIGLYDGSEFRCLVKGKNLDNFPDEISRYGMIVTFFGGGFDLPVLQRRYPSFKFDQLHIDLCPVLRQLGHRGGLKKIERQVGITRSFATAGLTGYDAVLLWRRYTRYGDQSALDRLVAYNRDDVVNLERLAVYAYEELKRATMRVPLKTGTG